MFTNRYVKNSFLNMCVLFVDMGFLMMVSNYFMVNWQSSFHIFTRLFGLLSATLFLQYTVQYGQSKDPNDRQLIQSFLIILGIRSAGVLIASFLPFDFGVPLYFTAVIISFILPVFYRRTMSLVPINFPIWWSGLPSWSLSVSEK